MRFNIPWIDLRNPLSSRVSIDDEDTGETIGSLTFHPNTHDGLNRWVTLFDRYHGQFKTHDECVAFAKGVETVLDHVISPPRERRSESQAA